MWHFFHRFHSAFNCVASVVWISKATNPICKTLKIDFAAFYLKYPGPDACAICMCNFACRIAATDTDTQAHAATQIDRHLIKCKSKLYGRTRVQMLISITVYIVADAAKAFILAIAAATPSTSLREMAFLSFARSPVKYTSQSSIYLSRSKRSE